MNTEKLEEAISSLKEDHLSWYLKEAKVLEKRKRRKKIILGAVLSLLVLLCILYACNYSMILSFNGLSPSKEAIIHIGIDANGQEYRIVGNATNGRHSALGVVTKNRIGLWRISLYEDSRDQNGLISISTLNVAGLKTFGSARIQTVFETHIVYAGNNAIHKIPDNFGSELPPNISVQVYQNQSNYILHFIYFGSDITVMNQVHPYELLKTAGCIE